MYIFSFHLLTIFILDIRSALNVIKKCVYIVRIFIMENQNVKKKFNKKFIILFWIIIFQYVHFVNKPGKRCQRKKIKGMIAIKLLVYVKTNTVFAVQLQLAQLRYMEIIIIEKIANFIVHTMVEMINIAINAQIVFKTKHFVRDQSVGLNILSNLM